jgi:hypothetical protein
MKARTLPGREPLLCGYGEADITPPLGVDLCGYGFYLDRKAQGIRDALKARALRLSRGGADLLIVSCDLLVHWIGSSDEIRAEIGRRLGLPRSSVLLTSSHTHSGPATRSMPGLGEADPAYRAGLPSKIIEAAERADRDLRPGAAAWAFETIEPIGLNRRTMDFRDIDPVLKTIVFDRGGDKVHLWSYACHAVVLGRQSLVSADWPGAAAAALEARGRRGVFLQGFCGDIDPVTQHDRWGEGTDEDLALYGEIIARRLVKAEGRAEAVEDPILQAAEARIDLPLQAYEAARIRRFAAAFIRRYSRFPGAARFADDWETRAIKERAAVRANPRLEDVPVQAMAIGKIKLAALPGEVYSAYTAGLRRDFDPLIPVGYANGVVGYIPTRQAYADPLDYGAWCAPAFYGTFPFRPDVGAVLTRSVRRLLRGF